VDPRKRHPTWAEIDLDAIEGNARNLKQMTGAGLMAVVKANAYGHGAVEAARAVIRGGASWLGVARPSEALQLRKAGVDLPILVLSPVPEGRLSELIAQGISVTVGDALQIDQVAAAARSEALDARIHLKLDTGMSRLGAASKEAVVLAERLSEASNLTFEGLFTHFAKADEQDPATTTTQLERFEEMIGALEAQRMRPAVVHAANSAATLTHPNAHFDMVRCGIALYGLHPSDTCRLPAEFKPAMQWKAQLVRVRELPPNTGVSYGHDYVTRTAESIGTMPVGYADGLRRHRKNRALVRGSLVPVVGRVCMDLSMLQLDVAPDAQVGDEVVLIGRQLDQEISAEDVARIWGTINYEVTCAIGPRVPRLYR
jgi:alanine racemase